MIHHLLRSTLLALNVGVRSVTTSQHRKDRKWGRDSRSAEAVFGRGPLVLGSILLDTSVLRGLVVLTTGVGLSALGTLNMGVGSVTECQ